MLRVAFLPAELLSQFSIGRVVAQRYTALLICARVMTRRTTRYRFLMQVAAALWSL
jgi:hypothetical protein